METSLKTGFAQIFSCCPKLGGAAAPLAPPARTPMVNHQKILGNALSLQRNFHIIIPARIAILVVKCEKYSLRKPWGSQEKNSEYLRQMEKLSRIFLAFLSLRNYLFVFKQLIEIAEIRWVPLLLNPQISNVKS